MSIWIGVAAAILLASPAAYSLLKRSDVEIRSRVWFAVHVVATTIGAVLAFIHSGGEFFSPPALLLLLLVAVMGLGSWIRVRLGPGFAARMGARPAAFLAVDPPRRALLGEILSRKRALLPSIDPLADEAEFSPVLRHWLRSPRGSLKYLALMEVERTATGARGDAGPVVAFSRKVHIGLGVVFLGGLLLHIAVGIFGFLTENAG